MIRAIIALIAFITLLPAAQAHRASDAWLDLTPRGERIAVRWDIALRDLDALVPLADARQGEIRWRDVLAARETIVMRTGPSLTLARAGQPCTTTDPELSISRRGDGSYLVQRYSVRCPVGTGPITIRYRLLADIDPTHRAIVSFNGAGLSVLRPAPGFQDIGDGRAPDGSTANPAGFFGEGFRHILLGPDHLAFVLALLLATLAGLTTATATSGSSAGSGARPASRALLGSLLATVTVFTVAHSITLVLTAIGWLRLPSRPVESLVAASVLFGGLQAFAAALPAARVSGLRWLAREIPWPLVFGFGLVHGIGFGSSLAEAGVGGRPAASALVAFNLGVEAGQIATLAAILPLAWTMASHPAIRRIGLPLMGLAIAAAGATWLVIRLQG